jgi:putative FmdB family regulatory protein
MPIYQYACGACGHRLEALQKISDDRLTECPACHKPKLIKQLTAAAFRLKGTGWYETDFKNSGAKPASDSSSDNVGSPNKKTSSDTENAGPPKKKTGSDTANASDQTNNNV